MTLLSHHTPFRPGVSAHIRASGADECIEEPVTQTAILSILLLAAHALAGEDRIPAPETALEWLKYGNERHQAGKPIHWHQSADRRRQVASRQRPYAAVLTCSDSQVPPEILFDQGLGDLYVVRVPGNIVGEKELASMEFAAHELAVPVVLVLGHQNCSLVRAAVKGDRPPGHVGSLVASLAAAIDKARSMPGDAQDNAARANVEAAVRKIAMAEPVLDHLAASRKLKVVGGYYSLETGAVEWLGDASGLGRAAIATSQRH
jgi:carbonic anhydrase